MEFNTINYSHRCEKNPYFKINSAGLQTILTTTTSKDFLRVKKPNMPF